MDVSGETGWVLNRWRAIEQRKNSPEGGEQLHLTNGDLDRGRAFMDVIPLTLGLHRTRFPSYMWSPEARVSASLTWRK
jgi:hypothetical protein